MSNQHSTDNIKSGDTQEQSPKFVDWVPESELNVPRKLPPRLYHKKSKAGCQQCRARKVKCNEIHPICGGCSRHQVACVWDRTEDSSKSSVYAMRPKDGSDASRSSTNQDNIPPPESKDRRILELRLLHQYTAETAFTINVKTDSNSHIWAKAVPRLALAHDALLYALYTFAALHLAKLEPNNPDHIAAYQQYLSLTLQDHRNDVRNLGPATADSATLTSNFLRLCSFAFLQERSLSPYTPPLEWLQMSSTTGQGLNVAAWKYLRNDESSIMLSLLRAAPGISTNPKGHLRDDDALFQESNRHNLLHLLKPTQADSETEIWTPEILHAYESTISYIGAIQLAIDSNELPELVFRRIVLFPMMVEKDFISLVQQRQPRALVILAHYFSYLTVFNDIWWISDTGPKEVRGIQSVLPEYWLPLMDLPLKAIGDVYVDN